MATAFPVQDPASDDEANRVLSEAVGRIADFWRLSNVRLGAIVGLSAPTVSRLRAGTYRLEPGSKPFEFAQHLLRLFRSLGAWLAGTMPPRDPGSSPPIST